MCGKIEDCMGNTKPNLNAEKTNLGFPITAIGYPSCLRSQGLQGYLNNTIEQRCPTIFLGSPQLKVYHFITYYFVDIVTLCENLGHLCLNL